MEEIRSKKMGEFRRSETEVEEEFYAVMETIKSEEQKAIDMKSTVLIENDQGCTTEKSSDDFEMISDVTDGLCRLCAIQNNDMINIFSSQGAEEDIVGKIERSLRIVVTETDTLPKQVCRCCLANLELCYQFHKTVAKAEQQLLALGKLGETERNDHTSPLRDTQPEPTANDCIEDPLACCSIVETSSNNSIDIFEEVQTTSGMEKENVQLPSVKPCSVVLVNAIKIGGKNDLTAESRWQGSIDTVDRDTASNIDRPNTSDPGVPRESADWSAAHNNKFSCSDCLKKYTSLEKLAAHMQIHAGQKLYSCKLCIKTFTTRKILRAHNRIHVDELAFSCNYCNKKFSGRRDRDDHQRIHTGERPYKCSDCEMTFAWRRSMIRHRVTHSNVGKYQCPLCDRTFGHSKSRNYHLQAIHKKNSKER